jgi:hypothetical protein
MGHAASVSGNPDGDRPAWSPLFVLAAALAVAAGIALLVLMGVPTRLIVVLAVGSAIVNLVLVPLAHRVRRRGRVGALTGRTLTPPAVPSPPTPAPTAVSTAPTASWVGGASLPTPRGRMKATPPFAVLTLTAGSLALSLQPKLLARLLRARPLTLAPTDEVEVFPVRTRGWTHGVGIRAHDGDVSYFWTDERDDVLQALASAGYRVSWDERRFVR